MKKFDHVKLSSRLFARLYASFAYLLLAMESHDVHTGLDFAYEDMPDDEDYRTLRQACVARQVKVTVPNPEPYRYLVHSWEYRGKTRTFRTLRGVVLGGL